MKLQTLRRRNVPFLYARSSGPRITLLPGVAFNLRRFGALIQLLARSAWMQHIRSNPRNAPTVGGAADLELFLFGGARVELSAARAALQDMQENRCFYCGSALGLRPSRGHVGAAMGEFEIHGERRSAVYGDTWRVKLPHSSLV